MKIITTNIYFQQVEIIARRQLGSIKYFKRRIFIKLFDKAFAVVRKAHEEVTFVSGKQLKESKFEVVM